MCIYCGFTKSMYRVNCFTILNLYFCFMLAVSCKALCAWFIWVQFHILWNAYVLHKMVYELFFNVFVFPSVEEDSFIWHDFDICLIKIALLIWITPDVILYSCTSRQRPLQATRRNDSVAYYPTEFIELQITSQYSHKTPNSFQFKKTLIFDLFLTQSQKNCNSQYSTCIQTPVPAPEIHL